MPRAPRRRRSPAALLALAALYAFVLLGSGFEHHDLECHLKSRTHCTSCVFSQAAAGVTAAHAPAPILPRPTTTLVVRDATVAVQSVPLFFGSDSSPPVA
jgi:hypothetical protein